MISLLLNRAIEVPVRNCLRLRVATLLLTLPPLLGATLCADELAEGRQVFEKHCAACHGAQGEGVKDEFDQPLIGDKSVGQLKQYIIETMPEDDPEAIVGKEAEAVSKYIHDAFYSEIAQDRMRPATIELSRLTVRQQEYALTDLIALFRDIGGEYDKRGMEAEYFNDRDFKKKKRVIERVDPTIDFQWGTSTPDPKKIDEEGFSIKWHSGLLVPETGEYEFVIETENGVRLYVNDYDTPFIDVSVKSGDQTEYRGRIRLQAGRDVPLVVEYFTSKKEETASIRLKWKPPQHATHVIPERALIPNWVGEVYVPTTPFPPDDRSTGYERGTSISKAWHEASTRFALEAAGFVAGNLDDVFQIEDDDSDREQKLRDVCGRFVERAFRRPLTPPERKVFIDRHFDEAENVEAAIKRVVTLTLSSPRFLYREARREPLDGYGIASWLSFSLWDSIPDNELWDAASHQQLETPEQIAEQANRMLDNRLTQAKLREFLHQWLNIDRFQEFAKDPQRFPQFDETLVSDLRTSLDLFLDDVILSDDADFRQLLLAETLFLNGRLAAVYGDKPIEGDRFQKVSFDKEGRAGVLSHPFLMAGFAYDDTTSPIHRGVFLARSLLGRTLKPPPIAVAPLTPDLNPDLTTRQRVLVQTEPVACQTCHRMINPLGFSLENFDAVGRFRTDEDGRPIDATGSYVTRDGNEVKFTGVRELAQFLANSEEAQEAFVEQLFQYTIKQPVRAFGPHMLKELHASFVDNHFNIRKLLAEIVTQSVVKARDQQP